MLACAQPQEQHAAGRKLHYMLCYTLTALPGGAPASGSGAS